MDPVVILAGASASVESGIPVFRGDDGLWEEHRIGPASLTVPWIVDEIPHPAR